MNRFKFRAWSELRNKIIGMNESTVVTWPHLRLCEYIGAIGNIKQVDMEIMQWSGLTDKDGIDIYESDIVKIWHEDYPEEMSIGKVIWNLGGEYPAFDIYIPSDHYNLGWNAYSDEYNSFSCPEHCIEVIGNIYENPELLKGNNK